ncbi:MAG: HAMP domain-containing protein [Bacteroidetes bacterium]|nr:MAG: HAMP domain-containing protein [Bacteroidota bacterium]
MKLSTGKKTVIGLSAMILFFLLGVFIVHIHLNKIRTMNEYNNKVNIAAQNLLLKFDNQVTQSEKLLSRLIFLENEGNISDYNRLQDILNEEYNTLKVQLEYYSEYLDTRQSDDLFDILRLTDQLFLSHKLIISELNNPLNFKLEGFSDEMEAMIKPSGNIIRSSREITRRLQILISDLDAEINRNFAQMQSVLQRFNRINILMGVILLITGSFIAYLFTLLITRPIVSIKDGLSMLVAGKLPVIKSMNRNDEIGEMSNALMKLTDNLKAKIEFTTETGKGNFEYSYLPASEEDTLGLALLEMRKKLIKSRQEEENRKIEDKKRTWSSQGVAYFGELLRQSNSDLKELSFQIIKNLIEYLKANQGGIFLVNDEAGESCVDLIASYAYDRRKFLEKRIYQGEGMVGACLLERETIFLTDVPEDYISITSGLGDANPGCVLIVPLKRNDEIYGVIEFAAFRVFEQYEIELVERIAESIASTIATVKMNIRTNELLQQSQEQSEELRTQEEEMRQNMEEMHATQEELERKELENQGFYDAMNTTIPFAEFSPEGKVININPVFINMLQYSEQQILSLPFLNLFDKTNLQNQGMKDILDSLKKGISLNGEFSIIKANGSLLKVNGDFKPVLSKSGSILKILFIIRKEVL